jgi:hypothetical protein
MKPNESAAAIHQQHATVESTLALATSYRISQAICVLTKLDIPEILSAGPRHYLVLAELTGSHAGALKRLLRALVAHDVLTEPSADHFALGDLGTCLRREAPNSIRNAVLLFGSENFWTTWGDLLRCVQTGRTAFSSLFGVDGTFDYLTDHPKDAALFNAGMADLARMMADAIVSAFDFSDVKLLVDVGGGNGVLISRILRSYPSMRGILFDLPNVAAGAFGILAEAGVSERCSVVEGDILADVPPDGDLYLLSRVIHDWEDEKAIKVLANCRAMMRPSSRLILAERAIAERVDHTRRMRAQLLSDLNMLVRNGGCERTIAEYSGLLDNAGLRLTETITTDTEFSLLLARRRQ